MLRLVPIAPATGERIDTTVRSTPAVLSWESADGRIDLAYDTRTWCACAVPVRTADRGRS